jgi:hypothetical protein
MITGCLLQCVIVVHVIGETVAVHFAEKTGGPWKTCGQHVEFERELSAITDFNSSAHLLRWGVEGHKDVSEQRQIGLRLQLGFAGKRQQRIGDQAIATFDELSLAEFRAEGWLVESQGDAVARPLPRTRICRPTTSPAAATSRTVRPSNNELFIR